MKARRMLLYYGVEHDQEGRFEEGMEVILTKNKKKNPKHHKNS